MASRLPVHTANGADPALRAVLLCAFAYLYTFPYYPGINNPNENVRFYMTASLVEEGRYAIDTQRARWGWVNDAAVYEGHVYSVKAPGTSLLGVPFYAAYRALSPHFDRMWALWWCRLGASILPTLLFLYFFHRHLQRSTPHPVLRECAFFSVALGSMLYGYGMLFVSHTLSAACAFGAYMLLSSATPQAPDRARRLFAAGLLCGGVTLFEYPGLLASLALAGLAVHQLWRSPQSVTAFALGGLLPALAVMHFQYAAFGNPFTPGHLYVESDGFRAAHHQGLYGAVGVSWPALKGLLFDLGSGLFPLTPLLFFAVPGAFYRWRTREHRSELLWLCGLCCGTTLAIAAMNNWRGGWTIGPRYLAVLVPFLAWLALDALGPWYRRRPELTTALALGSTAVGLLLSGVPSAYYPHVPPAIHFPVSQLISRLITHGFAPYTALHPVGIYGPLAMLPLAFLALLVLVHCVRALEARHHHVRTYLIACALPLLLCVALLRSLPEPTPKALGYVGFICRHWSPAGYDAVARLRQKLQTQSPPDPALQRQLLSQYKQLGLTKEAEALAQRLD